MRVGCVVTCLGGSVLYVHLLFKNDSHFCTQSADEDIEVVRLREQNAQLKREKESMVRKGT